MSSMFKKQQKEKKGWIEDSLLYMGCEKKMAPEMTTMIKCYFYSETKKYALLIFKQQEQKKMDWVFLEASKWCNLRANIFSGVIIIAIE